MSSVSGRSSSERCPSAVAPVEVSAQRLHEIFFQLRRAEAFEYVRVARSLVELTELREAFGRGRISGPR